MHASAVDLNLLPLLDALLTERHVTRAGRRVGLSQSAASHGLARLRSHYGDPLLVRSRRDGLSLTPRAEALRDVVRRAMLDVERTLAVDEAFDPARARRTLRIGAPDYGEFVLLPPLLRRLAREAPGIDLWLTRVISDGAAPLADGDLDAVISLATTGRPSPLQERVLFSEGFVCVMRKGHPLSRGTLTLGRFLEARHAFIAPGGARGGVVDDVLAARGLERRVALAVPHFLVAPFVVAETDLILTVAERVARVYARMLPLVVKKPPLRLPPFEFALRWHPRSEADPCLSWLRGVILDVAKGLRPRGR